MRRPFSTPSQHTDQHDPRIQWSWWTVAGIFIALGLIAFGSSSTITAILLVGWGLFSTAAPVGWGTWLSRTMPDDAEAGGGLQVATIQLAITLGASVGGVLFDGYGLWTTFLLAAGLLFGAFLLAIAAWRSTRR